MCPQTMPDLGDTRGMNEDDEDVIASMVFRIIMAELVFVVASAIFETAGVSSFGYSMGMFNAVFVAPVLLIALFAALSSSGDR